MNSRTRIILLSIGFLAVVAALVYGIVNILFKAPSITTVETPTEQANQGNLPNAQTGQGNVVTTPAETQQPGTLTPSPVASGGVTSITILTSSTINAATADGNNVSYFDPADGRFYMIDSNGNASALSSASFKGAQSVVISDNAKAAAVEFPDGSNIVYDFTTQTQTTLPSHWEDFDFSPDSQELGTKSVGVDPNNRSLLITSTDGSKTTAIAPLGENQDKVSINWSPNGAFIGFSETGSVQSGFGRRQIFLIGSDGSEQGAVIVEGGNFEPKWDLTGDNILYSVAYASNNNRPSLWYTNATGTVGKTRKLLPVETWVDKCTFYDNTTIYCAVPRELVSESGFDHNLVTASDDVYRIDLSSGTSTLVATPSFDIQMSNLIVSSDKSMLYFTDSGGRLSTIRLR